MCKLQMSRRVGREFAVRATLRDEITSGQTGSFSLSCAMGDDDLIDRERTMCDRWHQICDRLAPSGQILSFPYVPAKIMALSDEEFAKYLDSAYPVA